MTTRKRTDYRAAANRSAAPPARDVPAPKVRTTPVRVTLDLSPAQHAALKRWCNGAAVDLDLPNVSLAQVLRILGAALVEDDAVGERVRDVLRQQSAEE